MEVRRNGCDPKEVPHKSVSQRPLPKAARSHNALARILRTTLIHSAQK